MRFRHCFNPIPSILFVILCLFLPLKAFAQETDALDADLDAHWSTQNIPAQSGQQAFTTAHRFELALSLGYLANDDYYNYVPVTLDVHYRFNEFLGLMLRSTILAIHTDTTLSRFMADHQTAIDVQYLSDEQIADVSLMATFHPAYGKWTFDTTNLGYFDWGIFAGIGAVISKTPNDARTERKKTGHAEGILGTDFHFFFLDWLALRLEASMRFYKTPHQWLVPCSFTAGVSFFLPEIHY